MIIISCFALHNYLFIREHGLGSATYPPSPWVQLNASNSMSAVREFISLGLWGQWLWRGDVPIDGWVSGFCMGTASMLILMCLEKDTNFVHMPLRSVGKCTGMVPIGNCRIVCQCRLMLYMEYMRILEGTCFYRCCKCFVQLLQVL